MPSKKKRAVTRRIELSDSVPRSAEERRRSRFENSMMERIELRVAAFAMLSESHAMAAGRTPFHRGVSIGCARERDRAVCDCFDDDEEHLAKRGAMLKKRMEIERAMTAEEELRFGSLAGYRQYVWFDLHVRHALIQLARVRLVVMQRNWEHHVERARGSYVRPAYTR